MRNVKSRKKSHLAAILFGLAAGLGLPLVFVLSSNRNLDLALVLAPYLLLLYATAHLVALIGSGEKRPVQGVFWLFVFITMGVAPLAQATTGLSQRVMNPSLTVIAYGVVLAGLVSYDIGTAIAKRRESRDRASATVPVRRSELSLNRLRLVSFAALLFFAYNLSQRGIASYFSSRQEGVEALQAAAGDSEGQAIRGLLSAFGSVPQLVAIVCWILVAANQRRQYGKAAVETKFWLTIFVAVVVITSNFFTASRFWFLTVVVAIIFVAPWVRAAFYRTVLIGGAVAAVVAFPLTDVFRLSSQYREQYGFTSRGIIENLAVKDYDQMVMITNGLWYVDGTGFHLGNQMLGNLLFWVPRSIWPGKPIDTGVEIGVAMQSVNVNLSSPLWIELYVDFGLLAVILGFLLIGYLSYRGDQAFRAVNGNIGAGFGALSVLVPLIAGYQFILLRGPLLQSMGRLAVMLFLVWFLFGRIKESPAAHSRYRRVVRVSSQ